MKRDSEYTKAVYEEVLQRATIKGRVVCEWCKRPTKRYHMHHVFGRIVESAEVCIMLCDDYQDKCHDHSTGEGQMTLNSIKVKVSADLIQKYGIEEARKIAGGKLFFESESK